MSTSTLCWVFGLGPCREWGGTEGVKLFPLKHGRLLFPLWLLKFGNTRKCHSLSGRSAFPIPWSGGCLSIVSALQFNVSGKNPDLIFRLCLNRFSTYHMLELSVRGKPGNGQGNKTSCPCWGSISRLGLQGKTRLVRGILLRASQGWQRQVGHWDGVCPSFGSKCWQGEGAEAEQLCGAADRR